MAVGVPLHQSGEAYMGRKVRERMELKFLLSAGEWLARLPRSKGRSPFLTPTDWIFHRKRGTNEFILRQALRIFPSVINTSSARSAPVCLR
jgi:hypothetical protein